MDKLLKDECVINIMKASKKTATQIKQHIKYKKQLLSKNSSTDIGHDKRDKVIEALDEEHSGDEAKLHKPVKGLTPSL